MYMTLPSVTGLTHTSDLFVLSLGVVARTTSVFPQRDIADAEGLGLSKVPSFYIETHNLTCVAYCRAPSLLISAFPAHSTSFSPNPLQTKDCEMSGTVPKRL